MLGSCVFGDGCASRGAVGGIDACIFAQKSVLGFEVSGFRHRTRFPTFPSCVMRMRIRSAKGCRTISVWIPLMTFELCFCMSMSALAGESDQSGVATPIPSSFPIIRHHHPVPSYTMTITSGSKGKGRDLEMGWWQYLPLGERSQRCVNAFEDTPLAERNLDQLRGRDCQQYLRHIPRNHASLDGNSPLSNPSNFLCRKSLPRPSIPTTPRR